MYTLKDLIETYAEYNDFENIETAQELFDDGRISKKDLLEAYLYMEGIFGYTDTLWSIFESLK